MNTKRIEMKVLWLIRNHAGATTRNLSDALVWDKGGDYLAQHFETREQAGRWFRDLLETMRTSALISQSFEDKKWYIFDPAYDCVTKRYNG